MSLNDTRRLYKALKAILANHKIVTILGDFNMHGIGWRSDFSSNRHYIVANQLSYEFLEICATVRSYSVSFPTRGESSLDLILTSNSKNFSEVMEHAPVLSSNHNLVSFTLIAVTAANRLAEVKLNFSQL